MARPRKRKIVISLLTVASALSIGLLLLVARLKSNTPTMAFHALILALQNGDQQQIEKLCTSHGRHYIGEITTRYGKKRLGNYLATRKTVRPTSHLPGVVVFMWQDKSNGATSSVFFRWTWGGWKLSAIGVTPR